MIDPEDLAEPDEPTGYTTEPTVTDHEQDDEEDEGE